MSMIAIRVALKSNPEITGVAGTLMATVDAQGAPVLSYGVYWDDPELRVVGYDFRSPAELVWGEMILPGAEAEYEDEDGEGDEDGDDPEED